MSDSKRRIGVLLVNLGTPSAPTAPAVRRYLAEFLSDPRVVEIPQFLWQVILRAVVLRTRPKRSAEAYKQIWMEQGSPLAVYTIAQAKKLQALLGDDTLVDWAMRYGDRPVGDQIRAMVKKGCDRVLVCPLYPQYSGATTASVMDVVGKALAQMRYQPALRCLPPYFDADSYISALDQDLGQQIAGLDFKPQTLLLSFHGLPQRAVDLGDPYYHQCLQTADLLKHALGLRFPEIKIRTAFQSRFGRAKWIEPSTVDILDDEASRGTRRLVIAAPGFSADCLETLEELAIRGRARFLTGGGEDFATLSCLNDGAAGIEMLEALIRCELSGWSNNVQ